MAESGGSQFERLVEVMRTLRSPHGCAWDREQTLRSLRPFVLEETYELLDQVLFELRMRFVDASKNPGQAKSSIILP